MTSLPLSIWLIGSLPIFPSCSFSELQVPCWILLFKKLSSICLLFRWFLKKLSHSGLDWFSSFAPLRMGAFCVVMGPFNKSHIAGPFSSPLLSGFCGALCVFCYLLGWMCLPFYFTLFFFSSCLFYVRHFWRIISTWVHALHYCCGGDCLQWHSLRSDPECLCTAGQVCLFIFLISGCLFTHC